MVSALGALAGACITAGLVLAVAGLRRTPVPPPRPAPTWHRWAGRWARDQGRWLLAGVGAGLVTLLVTEWPVAAVAVAAGVVWGRALVQRSRGEVRIARLDALTAWTRRVTDILVSGAGGLEHAIATSARTCPPAISGEVQALAARARTRGLEPALRAFADDLDDPLGDRVVAALILRTRAGGRGLITVLDALATSIGEEVRARRLVEADRAKPRANTRAIAAITGIVLTGLVAFAGDYLAPFHTAAGQIVLAVIAAIVAAAMAWMHRLTQPQQTGRFLPPDHPQRSDGSTLTFARPHKSEGVARR